MNATNLLLAFTVVYTPYQRHYPLVFGGNGLNMTNLLFLAVLAIILARKARTATPAPLRGRFIFFFAVLSWSFLVGQIYDHSLFQDDLVALKTSIFYMLLYFLFYHAVTDAKSIRIAFASILFVTFLVSVQAFRQALDYGIANYSDSHRASGPFAEDFVGANLAAAYFVIFVPLFFAVAMTLKSRPLYRVIALACGVLGLFGAFFTYSRQAYFIFPLLVGILSIRRNLFVALLVGCAVLTYESWVPSSVLERINMTTEQAAADDDQKYDASTESRFLFWEGAKQMIVERPWGIGLNHFKREMGNYVEGFSHMDAHNGYVLVTTEAGLLGSIALIWLLIGCVGLGLKVERLGGEDARLLGGAYAVSALAVMLSNLFGSRLFDGEVMGNFWILSALTARYYTLQLESRQAAAGPASTASRLPGPEIHLPPGLPAKPVASSASPASPLLESPGLKPVMPGDAAANHLKRIRS